MAPGRTGSSPLPPALVTLPPPRQADRQCAGCVEPPRIRRTTATMATTSAPTAMPTTALPSEASRVPASPSGTNASSQWASAGIEWTENIPSGEEYLFGPTTDEWEAYFSFYDEGYVKDTEALDADALLATLREGQEASNEERRSRGWPELHIDGWQVPPRYNAETRALEWATRLTEPASGNVTINYNTRVLGRKGTMSVQVVARPDNFETGLAEFKSSMDGFAYNAGERYADYVAGDRVAEYGLAALITGGAVAVAGKKGFFGAIAAFLAASWKLLLAGRVGLGVWLKSLFKKKDRR